MSRGRVLSVGLNPTHGFGKSPAPSIRLLAGRGVEGDAHATGGLRQVHLLQAELFAQLRLAGYDIAPGQIGENVTTEGVDLPSLPLGARLRLGADAVVELTGLRDPCERLEAHRRGLARAVMSRDATGAPVRRAGVLGRVVAGGEVRAGDALVVELPAEPHRPLPPL